MITFQDFEVAKEKSNITDFMLELISQHRVSKMVRTAMDADAYDRQENITIKNFVQTLFQANGRKVENITASNLQIASNFFNTLR